MAAHAGNGDEFRLATDELYSLKIEQLKIVIQVFNDTFASNMAKTGNKGPLQDRIRTELLRLSTDRAQLVGAREAIRGAMQGQNAIQVARRATNAMYGNPVNPAQPARPAYQPPTYHQPQPSTSSYRPPSAGLNGPTSGAFGYQNGFGAYNTHQGLPAPKFSAGIGAIGGSVSQRAAGWESQARDINFKPSPLFKLEKALGQPSQCIKAPPGDRKIATIFIQLDNNQIDLLRKSKANPAGPQHKVFLFCTSEESYNPSRMGIQPPAVIEFPGVCEIKLNGQLVPANTKGIKKQPGTAPPVDLSKLTGPGALKMENVTNKVELIYMNTEKRFFLVPCLVQASSIKQVVERIQQAPPRSRESVIAEIIKTNSDDDIEATALSLTLRDPLTYSRIKTPIRSRLCNHIACFDAEVFIMMNEQTPQWNCPICSKTLPFDQLQVDGFFQSILDAVPASVEEVSVEPDATWRTSDGKFGTAKPKSIAPSREVSIKPDISTALQDYKPTLDRTDSPAFDKGKTRAHSNAIELSSSDEDDQPLAKRARISNDAAPAFNGNGAGSAYGNRLLDRVQNDEAISIASSPDPPSAGNRTPQRRTEVLDLTLSSDDDEDSAPIRAPPRRIGFYASSLGQAPPSSTHSSSTAPSSAGAASAPQLSENQKQVKDRVDALKRQQARGEEGAWNGW